MLLVRALSGFMGEPDWHGSEKSFLKYNNLGDFSKP